MESAKENKVSFPYNCEFCGNIGINKCGRCSVVFYCCKEHQYQHWPLHRKTCKTLSDVPLSANENQSTPSNIFSSSDNKSRNLNESERRSPSNPKEGQNRSPSNLEEGEKHSPRNLEEGEKRSPSNLKEGAKHLNEGARRSPSNLNEGAKRSPSNLNEGEKRSPSNLNEGENRISNIYTLENMPPLLATACNQFIRDMNSLGICVWDNLMGLENGNKILKEVQTLYEKGLFQKGKLVKIHPTIPSHTVRSDLVTWLVNPDPEYPNIGDVIQKIGLLINTCSLMPNRGILSRYKINQRSRVMIACYPGNGTHYQRHIDNPSKDGRCITAVYYLNHNWNETHGGVLRAYPCFSSQHRDIEPIFDRLVLFWSNERVPHEVLPVFATRFAITVWYLDEDEWNESLRRKRLAAERAKQN